LTQEGSDSLKRSITSNEIEAVMKNKHEKPHNKEPWIRWICGQILIDLKRKNECIATKIIP
jgi:hypothetical protein